MNTRRHTGKNDMLASEERKLDQLVVQLLRDHGAVAAGLTATYEYVVDTRLGPLRVSPRGHNIFCRFEDVARAVAAGHGINGMHMQLFGNPLNPHSGKWNHHYFGRIKAEDAFKDFRRMFLGLF